MAAALASAVSFQALQPRFASTPATACPAPRTCTTLGWLTLARVEHSRWNLCSSRSVSEPTAL